MNGLAFSLERMQQTSVADAPSTTRPDELRPHPSVLTLRLQDCAEGTSLFAFAGLWERWKDKTTSETLETYTVITTDPNELMESIHNRMPVILHRSDYER